MLKLIKIQDYIINLEIYSMLKLNLKILSINFFILIFLFSTANSNSLIEGEKIKNISSKECLEVLEYGNVIKVEDGKYPIIVYKSHIYFIQASYMGATKAYICKSKAKLNTN